MQKLLVSLFLSLFILLISAGDAGADGNKSNSPQSKTNQEKTQHETGGKNIVRDSENEDLQPNLAEAENIEQENKNEQYTWWFVIAILILSLITVILALGRLFSQRKANRILQHQRNILKETLMGQRISEEKYKALFSRANDAIFLMDHETFTDCNDKTLEMFACKREEIIGHPPYNYSPKKQPDGKGSKTKALELIELCISGKPQSFYWMHTKKDGTPFDAEVSLNAINLEGKVFVQAIVRNISERVKAEKDMLDAREKAEKATESKTFFLAKMSHEIRTMLGGISSSAQLLQDTKVDSHQNDLIDIINSSADNLLEIVNEILDLSKIEAGKIELEQRPFNPILTLEESVNAYMQKAREKGITLYLSIHQKIPSLVSGDELRLKQIIANLLSNAIKFTHKGSITLDAVVVEETSDQYKIEISITDTGIGIPPDKIKDMFAKYSQSDVSISRRFGGTGLGLNIVSNLVRLMNGKIVAESELKKGTKIVLALPFRKTDEQPKKKKAKKKASPSSKSYKILLAEDNVINQTVTLINLESYGHEVELAENGMLAWEKYLATSYDIILMDIQMPEMDGIEVTRMIRKYEKSHPEKRRTCIIALTANILNKSADYCLKEGMDDFISKPFKIENVIDKIEKCKLPQ